MKDSVSSVIRAYLDAVILCRLQQGDTYGYAVIKEVERLSEGECSLQEGPLYLEFRRMEQAGWIRSYWGDETHGARRRYYAVTDKGKAYLEERQAEWSRTEKTINRLLEVNGEEGEVQYE